MLLLTHIFVSIYVAYDAFLAAKLMYITLIGYFMIVFLAMIYAGPRPFWVVD
jgi:hypothetical protein